MVDGCGGGSPHKTTEGSGEGYRHSDQASRERWVVVAARHVIYTLAATRGREVLVGLLGAVFPGVL